MKQFLTVFRFEFKNYAKNKVFIAITLLAILLLGGVLFFPRLKEAFSSDTQVEEPGQAKEIVALADASGANAQESLAFFSAALPQYEWQLTDADTDALKAKVEDGAYRFALLLQAPLKYQYIVGNISMTDTVSYTLDELIVSKYRADTMQKLGLSAEQSQQVLSAQAQGETITTGKDQMKSYFYTFILMFALYMTILMYGQFVAQSVVTEKSSKAMELLITSAKPSSLMFGKVVGTGLAGLVQLVLIVGSAFVFFNLNKSYWDDHLPIRHAAGAGSLHNPVLCHRLFPLCIPIRRARIPRQPYGGYQHARYAGCDALCRFFYGDDLFHGRRQGR